MTKTAKSEDWKRIALEYKKEIQALWKDIDEASFEFEKQMPQSYIRALNMLERSLDFSKESVRILSYQEPLESNNENPKKEANERNTQSDRGNGSESGESSKPSVGEHRERKASGFEWLRDKGEGQ